MSIRDVISPVQTYFVWTCPNCGFTHLSQGAPKPGSNHQPPGFAEDHCPTPYSYVEVGTVLRDSGGHHYMKLPPLERRKRQSAKVKRG